MTKETSQKLTIGSVAENAIRSGANNAQALNTVLSVFPKAKTTMACIAWYRQKLRREGEPVPTATQIRAWERAMA